MSRTIACVRGALFLLFPLAVLSGCGSSDPGTDAAGAPKIVTFSAAPSSIKAGEATVLSWETIGASSIRLTPEVGEPIDVGGASPSKGSVEVRPAKTTRYVLEARGASDVVTKGTVKVTVGAAPAPSIVFEPQEARIKYGASTDLTWSTSHAVHVSIIAGEETLFDADEPSGTFSVSPTTTTTYQLVATGPGGTQSVTTVVEVAPVIAAFSADTNHAVPGEMVELRWETLGAETVVVSSPEGFEYVAPEDERESGRVEAPVGASGKFVLTVDRQAIEIRTAVELVVETGPLVAEFVSTPPAITESGTVVLSWKALNSQFVSIQADPGGYVVQQQPPVGSAEVFLSGATSLVLTAAGVDGSSITQTIVVPSVPAPEVDSFLALPARVGAGEQTELRWSTTNATRVEIEGVGSPGPLPPDGSIRVPVTGDTSFVLRAFNAAEAAVEANVGVTVGAPTILGFETAAQRVHGGAPITFSWTNLGGVSLSVLGPSGPMPGCTTNDPVVIASGTCTTNAPTTEGEFDFTLQVKNGAMQTSTQTSPVTVRNGPLVVRFETDDTLVNQGDAVALRWVVAPDSQGGAATLQLTDDLGNVYPIADPALGEGTIHIQDPGARTLRLVASSGFGSPDQAELEVEVVALPTVTFTGSAPSYDPVAGIPVILTWGTTGADTIAVYVLDDAGDPVLPALLEFGGGRAVSGSTQVTPNGPQDYRAVATNSLGATATAQVHVDAPVFDIVSFTATPTTLPAGGGQVTLAWQTLGATSVSLDIPQTMVMTPGTPPFVDIGASPTKQALPTDVCGTGFTDEDCPLLVFPSGFTFPFDGTPRTQARIYMNGIISFDTNRTGSSYSTSSLPSSSNAYVHLAPFWMDLYPNGFPMIYDTGFDSRGQFLIVQWPHYDQFGLDLNFEVIMWSDGYFEYRYGTMLGGSLALGSSASIGYQNTTGTSGIQVSAYTQIPGLQNSGYAFAPPSLPVNGSKIVTTTSTRTYTLTAKGPGGLQTTRTIQVVVGGS